MADEVDHDLEREFALELIQQVAPHELRIFQIQSEAYFADPEAALGIDKDHRGPLDIDVSHTVVAILTPVALAVATEVIKHLVLKTGKSAVDAVRRLLKRGSRPLLDLEASEQVVVRQIVIGVVLRSRRSQDVAEQMAETVAGAPQRNTDPEGAAE